MIIRNLQSLFNTDRVLKWTLILEEYGQDIEFIRDKKNSGV